MFRRLAASYGLNELGDNFGLIALAVLVFDATRSAWATAGLFLASKFVPALTAPVLTARLDRLATRVALPALYAAEALLFGLLAVVATRFSLAAVLVLAFLDGVLMITARGLSRAAVATVLGPRDALRDGNAILNGLFSLTSAAGPALAGVFVGATSPAAALVVDAASFALVAALLALARDLPPASLGSDERWLVRVRAGFGYVRSRPLLRTLVGAQAVALVFFTLAVPVEVVYAKRALHAGDAGYGALLAAWGVGMVLGAWVFARWSQRSTRLLVVTSTLLIGAAYLGFSIAPVLAVACAAAVVGGVGNGVQWIAVLTAVQEAVAQDYQARVVGLLESLGAAAPGVGFLLGGALTAVFSSRLAFLVSGLGVLVVAAAMARRLGSGP